MTEPSSRPECVSVSASEIKNTDSAFEHWLYARSWTSKFLAQPCIPTSRCGISGVYTFRTQPCAKFFPVVALIGRKSTQYVDIPHKHLPANLGIVRCLIEQCVSTLKDKSNHLIREQKSSEVLRRHRLQFVDVPEKPISRRPF